MRIDAGSQDGTSQGKTKRIYEVTARLFETVGVEVGPDLDNMERVPFRTSADPMDQGLIEELKFTVGLDLQPVIANSKDIIQKIAEIHGEDNLSFKDFIFISKTLSL